MLIWIAKIIAVIALLGFASALATPTGRLPLALRGMLRVLKPDAAAAGIRDRGGRPPAWKRLTAFMLVLAAVVVALI